MQNIEYKLLVDCMTFKHSPYIEQTMDGFVLQRTNFPFVCVIMDDASPDGEPKVIKKYIETNFSVINSEETDDYILFLAQHKTNAMCYFAAYLLKYNHYSIKKAKRPYLAALNSEPTYTAVCEGDDYWIDPQKLQKQVDFLDAHPDFGCVGTVCKSYVQLEDRYYEAAQQKEQEITFEDLLFDTGFATCTSCFRTELEKEHLRDVPLKWMMGDYPRWLYFATRSRVYRLGDVTSVYRVIPESASHSTDLGKYLMFRLSGIDCSHYFIEKYGLSQSREKEFCKKTAYQLYRTGLSLQNNDFIAASIKYKKEHHVRVTIKDYFTDFIFRSRPICSLMNGLIKLYRIIKRSVFGFKVRG
jgi:glycosyltransferase involved in cell wall biosynthesis